MPNWSAGLLPAPLNAEPGFKLLEQVVNTQAMNVVDVSRYGALGSGVADDAAGVQAAINDAPNNAVIYFPPGRKYVFSSQTPTLTGRSDLVFMAFGTQITLSGVNRQALLLSGTNARIKWYGGRILGSGLLSDNQMAIGTLSNPPAGTITSDLLVAELMVQDLVRGLAVDVAALGDATDITYRRIRVKNIVGALSGTGYGCVFSGVWGGVMDDIRSDMTQRHDCYISASKWVQLNDIRTTNHANQVSVVIARSGDVEATNITIDGASGNGALSVEPHEGGAVTDTGRIQLRNITITNTAAGQQDILIGGATPATSSLLYDVTLDGVAIKRADSETALVESIIVRHGTNIIVRDVKYTANGALAGQKAVVYLSAQGGDTYTQSVTVEGVRGRAPNLAAGGLLEAIEVNPALCGGVQRMTFRDNEVLGTGGLGGQAIVYDAARTNPNIESRFNRAKGPNTGTATLVGGTVTVSAAEVLAGDTIAVTRTTLGGTAGHLSVGSIVAGTSFVVTSSSGTDTSTALWEIVH